MKRIVITTFGLRNYPRDAVMELPDDEANDLVAGGHAVLAVDRNAPTAVEPVAEPEPADGDEDVVADATVTMVKAARAK